MGKKNEKRFDLATPLWPCHTLGDKDNSLRYYIREKTIVEQDCYGIHKFYIPQSLHNTKR